MFTVKTIIRAGTVAVATTLSVIAAPRLPFLSFTAPINTQLLGPQTRALVMFAEIMIWGGGVENVIIRVVISVQGQISLRRSVRMGTQPNGLPIKILVRNVIIINRGGFVRIANFTAVINAR